MEDEALLLDTSSFCHTISVKGFAVVPQAISERIVSELRTLCSELDQPQTNRRRGTLYGIRSLLSTLPALREMALMPPLIDLVRPVIGEAARPVKGVFFDKTPNANWPVPWHQDVTITVREHRDVPGYEMRPVKEGAAHALPPIEVSEQMLTLRIHLDDCGPDHGALRVIPGSHQAGRLDAVQTNHWTKSIPEETVSVTAGDVLLMRPLLLHCSSPCQLPRHRRVVHIEYAPFDLPGGLQWAE